ncbi:nucleotide-diphosphate-sugar epimerase [Streptomyces albospinus]|uniref:Nucleotide-diphosphate-sugar epimerase n=1 Tax=Streptomyces albospinus TaxID=285515 RepID=A0ABQ2VCQ5_9ACTN|nr:NAD(P)H-binding protein [Streptomyces albospinus]GGU79569.1 nucleotide-diphosphate-sugar epimerase [Streptomyces albospinus]
MSEKIHATVAVTGVTGALGGRIAARLAGHGVPQLLVGRSPDRMPELPGAQRRGPAAYADADAMRKALEGASTLILVSGHRTGRRLEEHATAVEAAIAVGVDRVLYVSLVGAAPAATYTNARDQWLTEQFLAGAGIRHTVLRAGFYTSTPAALANEEFVVSGPASTGRAAFVTHEDIADVITAVALDEGPCSEHDGATLEITGPEALTLDEAVTRIAAATGRPYRFEPETLEDAFTRRWRLGMSGEQIETWISWYQAIERGEISVVTDVVPRLTGSPATPISDAAWWPAPKTARGTR